MGEVFGLEYDECFAVLSHLNWQHEKLNEIWFDDKTQRRLCGEAGIGEKRKKPFKVNTMKLPPDSQYCVICCEPAL